MKDRLESIVHERPGGMCACPLGLGTLLWLEGMGGWYGTEGLYEAGMAGVGDHRGRGPGSKLSKTSLQSTVVKTQ
jgi:hypothetical protein